MGYRSYGQLVFPKTQMDKYLEKAGPKNSLDEWDSVNEINMMGSQEWMNDEYIRDNPILMVLDYSGWKWYESYPDIQAIVNFMNWLEENDHLYFFWRKGEDMEDIEYRGGERSYSGGVHLLDGYEEKTFVEGLHGYEDYDWGDRVDYYTILLERDVSTLEFEKEIEEMRKYLEQTLELTLEDIDTDVTSVNNGQSWVAKVKLSNQIGRNTDEEGNIDGDGTMARLKLLKDFKKWADDKYDDQYHIFHVHKPSEHAGVEIKTIEGPNDVWDYDTYAQVDVRWSWNPTKARPPNSINVTHIKKI